MSLISIPPELRLSIAELLDPRSCFQFSLTCHQHSRLLSSLITTHQQLWVRYNTIDTSHAGRLIWDVTKEVIETPKFAQYIEDISLPNTRQQAWDANVWPDELSPNSPHVVPEDMVQLYKGAGLKLSIMDDAFAEFYRARDIDNMEKSLLIGLDRPLAVILCCMATNLKTLRFTEFGIYDEFQHLLERVASAYEHPYRTPAPDLPFSRLTRVAVAFEGTEGCCEPKWAHLFLSIPTVTAFAAYKMGGSPDGGRLSMTKANVTELLFQYCFFDPDAIDQVLERISALRSFAYENGGACVSDGGSFAPRKVTESLVRTAKHSLEELTFIDTDGFDSEYNEIDYVSLREFERLKILRCPWGVVIGQKNEDSQDDLPRPDGRFYTQDDSRNEVFDLSARLPQSLEVLHLDNSPEEPAQWESLIETIRDSATAFPNLRQVYARNGIDVSITDLKGALKTMGIDFAALPDYTTASGNPLAEILVGQGEC